MAKIFVENTEIKIIEKSKVEEGEYKVNGDNYTMQTVVTTEFKSTIFSYPSGLAVLISKAIRFNEPYYKILLFNDSDAKAWQLELMSAKLNIKIKRLSEEMFLVVGESTVKGVLSQVSFYKLKPTGRVDNITLNFTKLRKLKFIGEDCLVLCYDEEDPTNGAIIQTLAMYNYEGKLIKKFYEFSDRDEVKYAYKIENDILKVIRKKGGGTV